MFSIFLQIGAMSQNLFLMLSTPDGVTTFSITKFSITIRKCDTQHKDTQSLCQVSFWWVSFMLSVAI